MSKEKFTHWYCQLQQLSQHNRWRNLVVLAGEREWVSQTIESMLVQRQMLSNSADISGSQGLIYQSAPTKYDYLHPYYQQNIVAVNGKNYAQQLGTEQQVVIFPFSHADNSTEVSDYSFDVDAFAALSGTLVAGGTLILTIDNDDSILSSTDYFSQRFYRLLKASSNAIIRQKDQKSAMSPEGIKQQPLPSAEKISALPYACVTQEQANAVDAMLKVMSGHRDRPFVLTADRGRGKSSALALAVCQLLSNAKQHINIIITAASRQSLEVFFQQVVQHLTNVKIKTNSVVHDNGEITFQPIDQLLKEQPQASLVMVDEAAALPVYLLHQLLITYHRLIFASTVHGYEGAGRGFSIKFRMTLNKLKPQWRKMHINEPIRWAKNDPLESFVFSSCLLNASLPKYPESMLAMTAKQLTSFAQCRVEKISALQLLENEMLLQQVFAVLVTAHYQTSPSDLKFLLNNAAVSLFIVKHHDNILGVAMLMREGRMASDLVALVKSGQRRMRDQFLPQSLLTHCGINDSFEFSYQRVMRIAIHPQLQGLGLGKHFLAEIERQVQEQGADFIGSSFAGNAKLLNFWQQNGFSLARIGFNKDKASGEHSCLVIKSLKANVTTKQREISKRFSQQFDYWLTDEFKHLSASFVWQVLHHHAFTHGKAIELEHQQAVTDFISGQRQFSSCVYGLHFWLLQHCGDHFDTAVRPLIARILQKRSIEQVCSEYHFTGKKALNQHIITYIAKYAQ
jgi:tRNA(Met) cytidine acetyltransferase